MLAAHDPSRGHGAQRGGHRTAVRFSKSKDNSCLVQGRSEPQRQPGERGSVVAVDRVLIVRPVGFCAARRLRGSRTWPMFMAMPVPHATPIPSQAIILV